MPTADNERVQAIFQPVAPVQDSGSEAQATPPNPVPASPQPNPVSTPPTVLDAQTAPRLAQILRDKGRNEIGAERYDKAVGLLREFYSANPDQLPKGKDPRIDTSPLPTGVREIDEEGRTVPSIGGGPVGISTQTFKDIDELPFDDPLRVRRQRAQEGVDMQSGLPFFDRASIALAPNTARRRSERIQEVMGETFAQIPDDLPKFRYDTALGEFQFLKPQGDGKFRWTSMDGTGIELGDLGDLLNPAEAFSLIGSVAGAGKGKIFTFGKGGAKTQAAVGGLAGGTGGRFLGEATSFLIDYIANDEVPTLEEVQQLGWDATKIEAFASLTGELGAAFIRRASSAVQARAAASQGRQSVEGLSKSQVEAANLNIQSTQEDLRRIKDVLGREDIPVTEGTATHNIDLIEEEEFAFKNASRNVQRARNRARALEKRATQDYINEVFGGNERFLGDRYGTVLRANDALKNGEGIVVAQTDDGLVHMAHKIDPENGLNVKPENDFWQVRGVRTGEGIRGLGLGTDLYRAAQAEARQHGKVLASDTDVSEDALKIWRGLDGDEEFGELIWNPNVTTLTDGNGRQWARSTDGRPVVRVADPEPVTPTLLETFRQAQPGPDGRFVKNKELSRFFRKPGRNELAAVRAEMESNPFVRQDMKEALYNDYVANVQRPDGSFSVKAFEEWKEEVGRVAEEVFSPEEMIAIRGPAGGMTQVIETARRSTEIRRSALSDALGVSTEHAIFKDPSTRGIWNQFKSLPSAKRRRAMLVLDSLFEGDGIRGLFLEELRTTLLSKSKGSNSAGYNKWLKQNEELIRDVMGTGEYINDLRVVGNVLKRRSDQGMVQGSAAEVNPTGIALTRVLFGPLSRIQRFISAARRGVVRGNSAKLGDLITDPEKLRQLTAIRAFPVESVQTARVIQDLGIAEELGWFSGESFDANNPEHRKEIASLVAGLLSEEMENPDESVEQE